MRKYQTLAVLACLVLAGCAKRTRQGVAVGAAGGAVVGGVIGKATGSTAKGAIIGAVVGGTAGAIIVTRMHKQAEELKQNIKGATVEQIGEGIHVTFDSGLLFDFDSDVVRTEARTNLRELARSLEAYAGSDLLIVGHTDQVGSLAYNQTLSEKRANSVATYLRSEGVAGPRLSTAGLGETEPIATNDTESGRQANRRVEVAIFASAATRTAARRSQ